MVHPCTAVMLFFAVWAQVPVDGTGVSAALTPAEKTRLEREQKIENRIRLYEGVSARHHRSVERMMQSNEAEHLEKGLDTWLEALTTASRDIETNIERKRKSKNLIRFEIHLRKALADVRDLNTDSSGNHHEVVESFLTDADSVRKKFVDILFDRR